MKARRLRNYASFQELETPYKFLCDHFLGPNTNVCIEHHYCSIVILFVIHPSLCTCFCSNYHIIAWNPIIFINWNDIRFIVCMDECSIMIFQANITGTKSGNVQKKGFLYWIVLRINSSIFGQTILDWKYCVRTFLCFPVSNTLHISFFWIALFFCVIVLFRL